MEPPTFDYIADDTLRNALEATATELRAVLRVAAPRAATLLARGSIERMLQAGLSRFGMTATSEELPARRGYAKREHTGDQQAMRVSGSFVHAVSLVLLNKMGV